MRKTQEFIYINENQLRKELNRLSKEELIEKILALEEINLEFDNRNHDDYPL